MKNDGFDIGFFFSACVAGFFYLMCFTGVSRFCFFILLFSSWLEFGNTDE